MQQEIKRGKYRHFKGNEYEVLCVAKHSETEEPMVVYRALYGNGDVWVRPASMWTETVVRDGVAVEYVMYKCDQKVHFQASAHGFIAEENDSLMISVY